MPTDNHATGPHLPAEVRPAGYEPAPTGAGSAHVPGPGPEPVRVGVFDSGVGGLSVLRALRGRLPDADLLYVADSGHAPYGERSQAEVLARSLAISRFLQGQGADVLVVACNTATAAAVHHLREAWPHWPIVGVEPGLKPAVRASRSGRIGVLATEVTLRSEKFSRLMQAHGHDVQVFLQPCPGLAQAIEGGRLDDPGLAALVRRHAGALAARHVDTVVLGCTHYPFVAHLIQAALPGVALVDTADAVAQRCADLVARVAMSRAGNSAAPQGTAAGQVRLWTTGDPAALARIAAAWLDFTVQVEGVPGV